MPDKSHHQKPQDGQGKNPVPKDVNSIIKPAEKLPETVPENTEPAKNETKTGAIQMHGGAIVATNFEEHYRMALQYVKSGMLPRQYNSAEKVITGMQYASELGLQPLTALRQIAIINGNPSVFGDLPLAMVKSSGLLESIKEFLFDENSKEISLRNKNIRSKPFGAACRVKRKGEKAHDSVFTLDDAVQAGLNNKDVWKNYTKTMLKYRARSMALKDVFPDVLNGVAIAEYDNNDLPRGDRGPMTADPEAAKDLDERITDKKVEAIKVVNNLFDKLEMNEAGRIRLISQFGKCEDLYFAKDENIKKLTIELLRIVGDKYGK